MNNGVRPSPNTKILRRSVDRSIRSNLVDVPPSLLARADEVIE